jgi:hypothetical protein
MSSGAEVRRTVHASLLPGPDRRPRLIPTAVKLDSPRDSQSRESTIRLLRRRDSRLRRT